MAPEPSELRAALVEAYPTYVARTLGERGIDVGPVVADAIVEGASVLDALLTSLESIPPTDQRHSPLELFREALRPVDHALDVVGAPLPKGHRVVPMASWDRYGLAPGSSVVLGTRAHEAHLAWGAAKAGFVAPLVTHPGVAVVVGEGVKPAIIDLVEARGFRVVLDETADVALALVEIGPSGASDAVTRFGRRGVHVIAFGDDVNDLSTPGIRALGASKVASTSDLLADPDRYLPRLV